LAVAVRRLASLSVLVAAGVLLAGGAQAKTPPIGIKVCGSAASRIRRGLPLG